MATHAPKRASSTNMAHYLRHTKIPTLMFRNAREGAKHVALVIESLIRENNSAGVPTVLGLPTGSTPISVYRELIRLHREEDLDFSQVVTFNLDEYWPMSPESIHSYRCWMKVNFFDHVNIPEENIHIPRGDIPQEEIESFCEEYERLIEKYGGIDVQLLGIGRSGHIGFNEPGSAMSSLTRQVTLDMVTRVDAAAGFFGEENVPFQAVTMGVGSILAARKVILMAFGEHKASVIRKTVEGDVTDEIPATFLQKHPNITFVIDEAAASKLTSIQTPWLVGHCNWTPQLVKRAVIWLSREVKKPLLKLEKKDFLDHHLHDLLKVAGPAETLRQKIFEGFMSGICTRPAGEGTKRIILFSPHPDDDVISMGGTLITLAEQGHEVYIAYMTSGNIAVFDHDALRHVDFIQEFNRIFGMETDQTRALDAKIRSAFSAKKPGEPDIPEVLDIKALIRQTEAVAGAKVAGVPPEKCRFLNLPFYQTGKVEKLPISQADADIIISLLKEVDPHQIYVAGDLSDPHGTHRMCASAIIEALKQVVPDGLQPEVWLYRGAWQEYEPHEIERVVPLSPEVTLRKKMAIFKHESQKDAALFPGNDDREFWIRAEERTKNTAAIYNALGLPEYFALEGFVMYRGQL
ncbi:MAG: glucosamine-6-phosphate deaminase [Planctomycetales bacterium]